MSSTNNSPMNPLEDLQKKYDQLSTYVKRLRAYQMKYEVFKNEKDLNNVKRYQLYIDRMLAEEAKPVDSKQLEIPNVSN